VEKNMDNGMIAMVSLTIHASNFKVWNAFVNPEIIKQYMFGTNVISDWHEGSPIVWKGEWQGKSYEDKGEILQLKPERTIQYSHFSPLSGLPDKPENYHIVTVVLSREENGTRVSLVQDHNSNEKDRADSEKNWELMLESMKKLLEE
jgi:uncharacterized protein YndB with AHSA1/START domain